MSGRRKAENTSPSDLPDHLGEDYPRCCLTGRAEHLPAVSILFPSMLLRTSPTSNPSVIRRRTGFDVIDHKIPIILDDLNTQAEMLDLLPLVEARKEPMNVIRRE
jgi:hypothetical protein